MSKNKNKLKSAFVTFSFTVFFSICIISAGKISLADDNILIGRVYKNNAKVLFNGVSVNEFTVCNKCGDCGFEYAFYATSGEIKSFLLNSEGNQLLISGKTISVPADKLKEENPLSRCLENPGGKNISFLNVEKAENIVFYDYVVPDKIEWGKPVKIKLHIKNPLENQMSFNIELFSFDSHLKENHILKAKEERAVDIDFNLSKQDWARDYGASIILEIKTSPKKDNCIVYFSDKLVFYGPDGELFNEE